MPAAQGPPGERARGHVLLERRADRAPACGVVADAPLPEDPLAVAPVHTRSVPQEVRVDGALLALHEWGAPDGRPVLFWHALGPASSGRYANELGPVLAERGFRVVAPDGPGHGGSPALPRERYALPALVRLVE